MNFLSEAVVQSLLVALFSALIGVLIAFLYLAWQWLKSQQLGGWADVLVRSAEQMLGDCTGEEKLGYVLEKLHQLYPRLDLSLIRAVVEASVLNLKVEKQQPAATGSGPDAIGWSAGKDAEHVGPACRYGFRIEKRE